MIARTEVEEMSGTTRIVYDKQCPACSAYCELAKANAPHAEIELIDARAASDLMVEITRRGMDIDEGMVVAIDGQLYFGADGIHRLATAADTTNLFNRFSRLLFGNRFMANLLYPWLKSARNVLLKLKGVRKINNLKRPGSDRF